MSDLNTLYKDRDTFFALPDIERDKLKDKEGINMGYVKVPQIREYLKVIRTHSLFYTLPQY